MIGRPHSHLDLWLDDTEPRDSADLKHVATNMLFLCVRGGGIFSVKRSKGPENVDIWAVLREKVPNVLSSCHGRTRPSFGMTPIFFSFEKSLSYQKKGRRGTLGTFLQCVAQVFSIRPVLWQGIPCTCCWLLLSVYGNIFMSFEHNLLEPRCNSSSGPHTTDLLINCSGYEMVFYCGQWKPAKPHSEIWN